MNNSEMPVADIMLIDLLFGIEMDSIGLMKTHMFCMDIDKVSKGIDIELPKEIFIDHFVSEIAATPGYAGFVSFCEVDMEGIRDLGQKAYELLM